MTAEEFIAEVRKGHTILLAYQRGNKNLPKLMAATHLRLQDVAAWVSALGLPLTPIAENFAFYPSSAPSFEAFNQMEA